MTLLAGCRYIQRVTEIRALEPSMAHLTDKQLQAKTSELKLQVYQGKDLDVLLPEAFAVVREASKRVLNMRHYDVQLVSLHDACAHYSLLLNQR